VSVPLIASRVVAAVGPYVKPRIRAILPQCDLRFVASGSELVQALDEAPCDMMIVELHFNESAAAAALRCALARDETFAVVCVRNVSFAGPPHAALNALRMVLGGCMPVNAFVDLVDYADDEAGNARVRVMLVRRLPRSVPRADEPVILSAPNVWRV
jgi:hypothetical protein